LVGVVIGGGISFVTSWYSTNRGFQHQLALETLRNQQRIDAENRVTDRDTDTVRRQLSRSLRRLFNTSRMSTKTRVFLDSWSDATNAFTTMLDRPEVDRLLSVQQYDFLWRAAGESGAVLSLLHMAEAAARDGRALNAKPLRLSLALYFRSMREAFEAMGEVDYYKDAGELENQDFRDCGIFMGLETVFVPIPSDGKSFIVFTG
jgi:hypothetical protein